MLVLEWLSFGSIATDLQMRNNCSGVRSTSEQIPRESSNSKMDLSWKAKAFVELAGVDRARTGVNAHTSGQTALVTLMFLPLLTLVTEVESVQFPVKLYITIHMRCPWAATFWEKLATVDSWLHGWGGINLKECKVALSSIQQVWAV